MRVVIGALAFVIVYMILRRGELYVPRILDDEWFSTRNDPERKGGPFNKCSPESFDECAEIKYPNLSRY